MLLLLVSVYVHCFKGPKSSQKQVWYRFGLWRVCAWFLWGQLSSDSFSSSSPRNNIKHKHKPLCRTEVLCWHLKGNISTTRRARKRKHRTPKKKVKDKDLVSYQTKTLTHCHTSSLQKRYKKAKEESGRACVRCLYRGKILCVKEVVMTPVSSGGALDGDIIPSVWVVRAVPEVGNVFGMWAVAWTRQIKDVAVRWL